MLDHISIPVSNLQKSKEMYKEAFRTIGFKLVGGEEGNFWSFDVGNKVLFQIRQAPPGTFISPCHVAFRLEFIHMVASFSSDAQHAGFVCNGALGFRPQYSPTYFACYVLDPDGHNIECMLQ